METILLDVEQWEADALKCFESDTQHDIPEIEELFNRAEAIEGELPSQTLLKNCEPRQRYPILTGGIEAHGRVFGYCSNMEKETARSFLRRNSVLGLFDVLATTIQCRDVDVECDERSGRKIEIISRR